MLIFTQLKNSFSQGVTFINCFQIFKWVARVLAKPYLMTLYVIFPIHVNFQIRSSFVLKAFTEKTVDCFPLLEKVFFQEVSCDVDNVLVKVSKLSLLSRKP